MSKILKIRDLSVEYFSGKNRLPALRGVDIDLEEGETIGIVGESGCGKSTLALAIMGIINKNEGRITSGKIKYYTAEKIEKEFVGLSSEKFRYFRGNEISMIMQDPYNSLNPVIKIGKQLEEAYLAHNPFEKEKVEEVIDRCLKDVHLPADKTILNSYPHQLSGGMLQRVNIAMALINQPRILLADEPTSNLDVTIQKEIIDNLKTVKAEFNLSMIFITHNLNLVSEFADKIYVFYAGKVIEYSSVSNIFSNPIHPYTRGLINTLAGLSKNRKRIFPIPGSVPNPLNLPAGCAFSPRCKIALVDRCMQGEIELKEREKNHFVRCTWT